MMQLKGVMPALVTPFDSSGRVDFGLFEKLLVKLRADGVKGWVPCGSTGEYNALTADERVSVLKFVAEFAARPGKSSNTHNARVHSATKRCCSRLPFMRTLRRTS
jgi:dihydrodipicolinate synthase/N-acetylneuraminate lyase